MVKLDQLISHPLYSPNLAHSDYYQVPNMNRWLQGKRFISNKEIIAEIEAYFEFLDVSYYRECIEMLKKRYIKREECLPKTLAFIKKSRDFSSMQYNTRMYQM